MGGWTSTTPSARTESLRGCVRRPNGSALAAGPDLKVVVPVAAVAAGGQTYAATPQRGDLRCAGVQRWVDRRGSIRLAGFGYRVPIVLAGEAVEAVVAETWFIYHHDVLVASPCSGANSTPQPRCYAKAGARLGR